MATERCHALVVGAGVAGLTTGVCLAERGLAVTIVTDRPPAETASAAAGAIWGLHLVETSDRVSRWARETLAVLRPLSADPATGVRIATGVEAIRRTVPALRRQPQTVGGPAAEPGEWEPESGPPDPAWLADLGRYSRCGPADLPGGFDVGWRYTAPLVHMPTYLGYLLDRFVRAGGHLEAARITSLASAARAYHAAAVVNCSGSGAFELVPDQALLPVRGDVIVVANPGISDFFIGLGDTADDLVCVFPHDGTVVLGGTEQAGEWSLAPSPDVAARILRSCAAAEPRLEGVRVLAHRVGLRPCRPRVRLEAEHHATTRTKPNGHGNAAPSAGPRAPLVVHNYGHGGAGVSLSWGCAREAAHLLATSLRS